jgi:uncharacterized protein YjbJ (UPF0337 family)
MQKGRPPRRKATGDKKMERKGKTAQTKINLKQAGEKTKDAFDK